VKSTDNATEALAVARDFLTARPVLNALLLFFLEGRARRPTPGRYWIAQRSRDTVGVALQSPLDSPLAISPMPSTAVRVLVKYINGDGVRLPAVIGDVRTASRFAAEWAEVTKGPVTAKKISRL
jgi:hypothetical protein